MPRAIKRGEPWRGVFGRGAALPDMSWLPDLARSIAGSRNAEPDDGEPVEAEPIETPVLALSGEDPRERRTEARQETDVSARLRLPATEHDCRIVDLSTGGMSVAADVEVAVGQQVSVVTQNFPRLAGIVRWMGGGAFGVQFSQPITPQLLEKMGQIRRRIRLPRALRMNCSLPSIVYFDGVRHEVVIENISVGGMMMTTEPVVRGTRRAIRHGQPLMIEFPDMLPIGGHVRWTCGTQCGVMFSRLLSIAMAEELRQRCNLSHAWLEDVRQAHIDFAAGHSTEA